MLHTLKGRILPKSYDHDVWSILKVGISFHTRVLHTLEGRILPKSYDHDVWSVLKVGTSFYTRVLHTLEECTLPHSHTLQAQERLTHAASGRSVQTTYMWSILKVGSSLQTRICSMLKKEQSFHTRIRYMSKMNCECTAQSPTAIFGCREHMGHHLGKDGSGVTDIEGHSPSKCITVK